MGYLIQYSPEDRKKYPPITYSGTSRRKRIFKVVLLIVVLLSVLTWKNNDLLREWVIPGDPETTRAALEMMADHLRTGHSMKEAVTVFCQQILIERRTAV